MGNDRGKGMILCAIASEELPKFRVVGDTIEGNDVGAPFRLGEPPQEGVEGLSGMTLFDEGEAGAALLPDPHDRMLDRKP